MPFPCTTVCLLRGHLQKRPPEKVPRGVPAGPSFGGAQGVDRKQEEKSALAGYPRHMRCFASTQKPQGHWQTEGTFAVLRHFNFHS